MLSLSLYIQHMLLLRQPFLSISPPCNNDDDQTNLVSYDLNSHFWSPIELLYAYQRPIGGEGAEKEKREGEKKRKEKRRIHILQIPSKTNFTFQMYT